MAKKKSKNVERKPTKRKKRTGRKPGSTTHVPKGLEVRSVQSFNRSDAENPLKNAYRRVTLETADPEIAKALYKLASLVKRKDSTLRKLIGWVAKKNRSK